MLELAQVSVQYGKRPVLRGISLRLDEREIVSLLGANAAGETTTLRSIMGLKALSSGSIRYPGEDITRLSTVDRVRRGVTLAPEGRQVFSRFRVIDNLIMGAYHRADRNRVDGDVLRVFDLFPQLAERRKQMAGSLSGGEQQMLAIGRALMSRPHCLLLDEPTLGLAPIIVAEIERIVRALAADGMTILIAEQNALEVSHRVYVLEAGRIARDGFSAGSQGDGEDAAAVSRRLIAAGLARAWTAVAGLVELLAQSETVGGERGFARILHPSQMDSLESRTARVQAGLPAVPGTKSPTR